MRGRRRGKAVVGRTLEELRIGRIAAGVSIRTVADDLRWSASAATRFLAGQLQDVGVIQLSEVANVLGFEISLGLHPVREPIRDKGQRALGKRFDAMLSTEWTVTDEAPLPIAGDLRAWDKLLRLTDSSPPYLVGIDLETRITDIQAIVRRTRLRERDGGANEILIGLSDSATNRRLVDDLRASLGDEYKTPPRAILRALRSGQRLVGSGVVLV
jgi:hypothetical protein